MVNTSVAIDDIRNLILEHLSEKYKYGAVGIDDSDPSMSDVKLGNEVFRKELQEVKVIGNSVIYSLYLSETEANGYDLKEFGIFDEDSGGMMLCREKLNIFKTSDEELWIDVEEQVEVVSE